MAWASAQTLYNVVGTVNVQIEDSERLDLNILVRRISDAEYNPERFPGVIMRIEEPKATFLVFSTGKMVMTGLRMASNAEKAVEKLLKKFKKAGVKISNPQIKIVNIVASGKLGVNIDLNTATIVLESAMYEPEIFPGLIYRMKEPKAVFLMFSTGKIVCTGIKNEETVKAAILKLHQDIQELDLIQDETKGDEYQDLSFF